MSRRDNHEACLLSAHASNPQRTADPRKGTPHAPGWTHSRRPSWSSLTIKADPQGQGRLHRADRRFEYLNAASTRHAKFYFEDGSVVFQVPGPDVAILYRLPLAILICRSSVFATLFSIPRNAAGANVEGRNDDNPVILWGVEQLELDRLLAYMIGGYSVELYQIDAIMSVLKLSAFFEIQDGMDWALVLLPQLSTFTAPRQMEAARRYCIDDWIEPAFRALMKIPLQELTMGDALSIGLPYYWILINTQAKIDHHRRDLAFAAPDVVHGVLCESKAI
ncbi:hypothetical protein HWV62_40122 [Athelia sp. TMB]|nr:hypothetical protein HWV62_40122 [Athelia sp. TMB]